MQVDYSRFLRGYKLSESENMDVVIEVFEDCVNRYGRMQTLMTDAGSAFYSWNGINRFLYGWNKHPKKQRSENPVWEEVLKVAIGKIK